MRHVIAEHGGPTPAWVKITAVLGGVLIAVAMFWGVPRVLADTPAQAGPAIPVTLPADRNPAIPAQLWELLNRSGVIESRAYYTNRAGEQRIRFEISGELREDRLLTVREAQAYGRFIVEQQAEGLGAALADVLRSRGIVLTPAEIERLDKARSRGR